METVFRVWAYFLSSLELLHLLKLDRELRKKDVWWPKQKESALSTTHNAEVWEIRSLCKHLKCYSFTVMALSVLT